MCARVLYSSRFLGGVFDPVTDIGHRVNTNLVVFGAIKARYACQTTVDIKQYVARRNKVAACSYGADKWGGP